MNITVVLGVILLTLLSLFKKNAEHHRKPAFEAATSQGLCPRQVSTVSISVKLAFIGPHSCSLGALIVPSLLPTFMYAPSS
jgi:hypothetical protein